MDAPVLTAGNLTQAQTDMQTAQAENTKAQNYLSLAQQIQTVINNGDTVEIIVDRNRKFASPKWMDFVVTTTARHQISKSVKN